MGRVDLYIGGDPVNALAGLLLRKLGFARFVIFYKIDYVPQRFGNVILNRVYHQIDDYCSRQCDYTWNLSRIMIEQRIDRIGAGGVARQIIVPIGANFERIERLPIEKVPRRRLAYMGSLRANQGIELAISAFPRIKERFPDAELLIIGSGPMESKLKLLADQTNLKDIVFTGQIIDHKDVEQRLSTCGIGLAPYEPTPSSYTPYTEPGKVKVYLACGLPVIITNVPKISRDIENRGAGIVIEYSVNDLVNAVAKLVENDGAYRSARKAAVAFASEYSWTNVFDQAFERVFSGSQLGGSPLTPPPIRASNRALFLRRSLALTASNKYIRRFGVYLLSLIGRTSAKIGLDPILERRMKIIGVDGTFAFHLLRMDMAAFIEVYVNHVYDRFCSLSPGEVVVDCGAYIGEFTLYAAKKVGEKGLVLAFEPNPMSVSLCKRNIVRNHIDNVKLFDSALGREETIAFLRVNKGNLGASTLESSGGRKTTEKVLVRTLDQFLPLLRGQPVKLLKIDAEGFGFQVLLGARGLLERNLIQNVSAEVHPGEEENVQSFLEKHGFNCIRHGGYVYGSVETLLKN